DFDLRQEAVPRGVELEALQGELPAVHRQRAHLRGGVQHALEGADHLAADPLLARGALEVEPGAPGGERGEGEQRVRQPAGPCPRARKSRASQHQNASPMERWNAQSPSGAPAEEELWVGSRPKQVSGLSGAGPLTIGSGPPISSRRARSRRMGPTGVRCRTPMPTAYIMFPVT